MGSYRVISSDSHVVEPQDLWTSRMPSKFGDRTPHIESLEDADWWFCDGRKVLSLGIGSQAGLRFEDVDKLRNERRYEEVRPGGYIPQEHVKDMDVDGVDVGIIYPSIGFVLYGTVPDSELLTACFAAYNDWVAEFCSAYPKRLKGIALLNVDNVQVAVKELERCAKLGFTGAMIPSYPPEEKRYYLPEYDQLWAAAQDLDLPISLHAVTNRPSAGEFMKKDDSASYFCNVEHWVRMSLGDMILSGVFEHYPKLQVGSVENDLSWAVHFLYRIDYCYTQTILRQSSHRFKEDMLPSDCFRRNVFLGFQQDPLGIRLRDVIGVDNLQWGSDYPHQASTFPRSQEVLGEMLAECSEEESSLIAGGNAARIYKLD